MDTKRLLNCSISRNMFSMDGTDSPGMRTTETLVFSYWDFIRYARGSDFHVLSDILVT